MYFILTLCLFFFCSVLTLDITIGKSESCKQDTRVTAIMENLENSSLAYLFSGPNVWTFDIEVGELIDVEEMSEVFRTMDSTDKIILATEEKYVNRYLLLGEKHGYIINASRVITKNITSGQFSGISRKKFNIQNWRAEDKRMTCTASYITSPGNYAFVFLNPDGITYFCQRTETEALNNQDSFKPCDRENIGEVVKDMIDLEVQHLTNCEGLMIDEGPEYSYENDSKHRLLFADEDSIRLWTEKTLKYDKTLSDLFGCKTSLALIIIMVTIFIVLIIIIPLVVITILLMGSKRRLDDENTFSVKYNSKLTTPSDNKGPTNLVIGGIKQPSKR